MRGHGGSSLGEGGAVGAGASAHWLVHELWDHAVTPKCMYFCVFENIVSLIVQQCTCTPVSDYLGIKMR